MTATKNETPARPAFLYLPNSSANQMSALNGAMFYIGHQLWDVLDRFLDRRDSDAEAYLHIAEVFTTVTQLVFNLE